MRIMGVLLFLAGSAATAFTIRASFASERRRAVDVVLALASPVAVLVALLGLLLVFVPGFLGNP
jgi:hypothetical protein